MLILNHRNKLKCFFSLAGDNERSMKLPISFMCDRTTTAIPKSQSGMYIHTHVSLWVLANSMSINRGSHL